MTDHKANAIQNLRSLHDWQSDEGITDATLTTVAIEAVAQATLYLAEQQRLANLIAYLQIARMRGGIDTSTGELDRQVRKLLAVSS